MPSVDELPADIVALAELNAIELRHTRFDDDFRNLVRAIAGQNYRARTSTAGPILTTLRRVVWGALSGAVLALVGLAVHFQVTGKSASERIAEDAVAIVILPLTLIGGLIGYWRAKSRR
jgi:hypothetical protein